MNHNSQTTPNTYSVRRATTEDLAPLRELWKADQLPVETLEKKFGEFQVVTDAKGQLVAALALQIQGKDGFIHSESYKDFGLSDTLRPILWERFQNMINNHGLYRIWTREKAPFWKQIAFNAPTEESLSRLPATFGAASPDLLYQQLKDEGVINSLEKEFELFRQSEEQKTAELMNTAKSLKTLAIFVGVGVFCLVIACAAYLIKTGHLFKK